MSKVAIQGNASGSGVFTIAAPNSNSDRTLNLPDSAGTLLHDASSLAAANLTGDVAAARITGALNATGSAPIYACRAWVNFNGTGTVAIRASGNVSSITDNATGNYTINFTTAMPDANYTPVVSTISSIGVDVTLANLFDANGTEEAPTVNGFRVRSARPNTAAVDLSYIMVAVFR